jgi:quinol monooxygenase YgiN
MTEYAARGMMPLPRGKGLARQGAGVFASPMKIGQEDDMEEARDPYIRLAEIDIDPAQLDAYTAAVREEIESSVRLEPGVLALYAVSDKDNPARIIVLEMYADREAYEAHLVAPHFKAYKSATQHMVRSLKLRETVPIVLSARMK